MSGLGHGEPIPIVRNEFEIEKTLSEKSDEKPKIVIPAIPDGPSLFTNPAPTEVVKNEPEKISDNYKITIKPSGSIA